MIKTESAQGSRLKAQGLGTDARVAIEVGRCARLELRFAVRGGKTILADAYGEPPFRVGRCFVDGDGLHMIMASSSPGIFGGDRLEQTIHVDSGACVRLTSQSAMQVHPSRGDATATLCSRYVVESDASLSCSWDPMIPFAGSRLDQSIALDIAAGGRLLWSDAFMAGREARGERWKFALLAHELRLTRAGTLAYLERYRLEPSQRVMSNAWIASDACYFGSTLICGGQSDAATAERLHLALSERPGVRAAADAIENDLTLVRIAATAGPAFHAARIIVDSLRP